MSDYFRLERWEIPPADGAEGFSEFGGRMPVDSHHRGAGGGLRTGALLTNLDSVGGFLSGLSVLPRWIVTTSLMATVTRLDHLGPLRVHGRVLRRGRNSVVAGLDVVDEGRDDALVAASTGTFAVLDPGDMNVAFDRPAVVPMPPPAPDAPPPEEFFRIRPGVGTTTRLEVAEHLRNPWGILHGGAVAVVVDVAACRAVAHAGRVDGGLDPTRDVERLAAADTVLHYLRPARIGPVEARCRVLGGPTGRDLVRVAVHDVGAADRLVALGSVVVLAL
jgi:acyl-coenzyme A thioesterase PaaI-like protein